jgi:spermidine synthase
MGMSSLNDWMTEVQTAGYRVSWKLRRVLHAEQTPFQHLQVVDLVDFGRTLVLDHTIQTSVGDEYIYHEMVSHVPLFSHPSPARVLIIGGGDGGTAREVLRHSRVKRVDMVEIDAAVVEASRRHLPEIAAELDNPRLHLKIADGIAFVQEAPENLYDVVIIDSSDPVGPAEGLFNQPFYENVHRVLKPDGLVVCQTISPFFHQHVIRSVHAMLSELFSITRLYLACIPTYPSGLHSFTIASKRYDPLDGPLHTITFPTRWYSEQIHRAAFVLPPVIRNLVSSDYDALRPDSGRLSPTEEAKRWAKERKTQTATGNR